VAVGPLACVDCNLDLKPLEAGAWRGAVLKIVSFAPNDCSSAVILKQQPRPLLNHLGIISEIITSSPK
jgi:hypothetical protein